MSRFFLDRPVFAWVIAISMMLAGASRSTAFRLPVPAHRPPSIMIRAIFPGPPRRPSRTASSR